MSHLDPIDFESPDFGDLYDELPLWSAPFGLWILDRIPVAPGLTFADIGCGTGFLSIELAERCGAGSTVLAVDPWAAAMRRLRRKVQQRRLTNLRLLEQDAATLGLPDDSVDVVVSNLGINNFDSPTAVLETCRRVAKPGASLLLTTNLVGHMAEFYEVFRRVLLHDGQSHRVAALDAHVGHRATVDSVRALLEAGGFEVTEIVTDAFRLRFADGSALLRHFFIRLGFLPAWIGIADAGRVSETFSALEAALNAEAGRRGELTLTVPWAGFVARKRGDPADAAGPRSERTFRA